MYPCLSWITLTMLTTAQAAPPVATAASGPANPGVAAPTAGSQTAPGAGATNPSDPEARAEQAATLYTARKYVEAAEILEDLWATVHEPRDLFNAALARMAAGHRSTRRRPLTGSAISCSPKPPPTAGSRPRLASRRPRPARSGSASRSRRWPSPRLV